MIFLIFSISALALDVEFLTQNIQSNAGDPVNISVVITDNGTAVNNSLVNFTTDMGILSSSYAYSNSSGIAEVIVNSTASGIAHINASTGGAYNLKNITFLPLETYSILIDVEHSVNSAGNITNITFYPKDVFGNINSTEIIDLNVLIKDTSGNTIHDIPLSISSANITYFDANETNTNTSYTSVLSEFSVLSLNSTVAGNISITSTVGLVSNTTQIEIIPGSPGLMGVVYNDDYTVNTNSSMYVSIYDRYENPIKNANVTFNVRSPVATVYNSPVAYDSASINTYNGLTDANGKVSNIFTTDKRAGENIVGINVINTSLKHNISITGLADEVDNLFLTYTPKNVIANNIDTYTLSAQPVDKFLNPILPSGTSIKEQVRFTTDDGTLLLIPLNIRGHANTVVGPTPYIESLSVTATYKNESGYTDFSNNTTLKFTAGPLSIIDFYSVPDTVLAQGLNGNHEADVTLVALDKWGHSLSNISFVLNNTNTTVGTFTVKEINSTDSINATTDSEGRIYGTFLGNVSGNTTLMATCGNFTTSTKISVKAEPFMSVSLQISPSSVNSGSIVNVTTIISVEGELPITRPAASAMLVLDRSGSMDPDYYAGTPLDVVLVLDRSGSMYVDEAMLKAKTASKEFASNLVSNSRLGVVSFAWEPFVVSSVDLGLTPLNSSASLLLVNSSIDKLHAVGGTAMGEGMADANDMLIHDGRSGSRKVMVVLTDGKTNRGSDKDGINAVDLAKTNDITIYTIGLGPDIDEGLLRSIAMDTGGKYYSAPSSSELISIYNAIAQDISDYDVTDIEYGLEGFTPYSYMFNDKISIGDVYTLKFVAYDFDSVFDASPYYGGTSAGEGLIQINGKNFELVPSLTNSANSDKWKKYEYNITDHVHSGENIISFYDYYEYTGYRDYDDYYKGSVDSNLGNNKVRNVEIYMNENLITSYADETLLDGNGYVLSFDNPLSSDYFEDTFEINESINDLKVELQWDHDHVDLDLQLISPTGRVYGIGYDSTGYYVDASGRSEYIWVHPLSDFYPNDDGDAVEIGNWTVRVTGQSTNDTGALQKNFTISTYIDKKSAAKLSSHAFISSFDESRGDKAGLALYSFEDVVLSDKQTSYILDNSTWVGYFTVDETGYYTFNVSWEDTSLIDTYLYGGIELLDSSNGTGACAVSHLLSAGETYHLDIAKGAGSATDTQFTVNVSTSSVDTIMTAYYDSTGGGGTPKFRTWDAIQWSVEQSANYVGGSPYHVVLESNPHNSEIIMGTSDSNNDVNVQIWDDSSWSSPKELSTNMNANSKRGFDVKYEQVSDDAIVVYVDKSIDSGIVPQYTVWNGSSWSSPSAVNGSGAGSGRVNWVKLAADPNSDKMALVTQDDSGRIRAQIWDGSSWDNSEVITDNADGPYQSFDATYDRDGNVMVVWADWSVSSHFVSGSWFWKKYDYTCDVRVGYHIFSNGSWESGDINSFSYSQESWSNPYSNYGCWLKVAADPNSGKMIMALSDASKIRYATWDGSSWEDSLSILEHNVQTSSICPVDVAFESTSGDGIIVWGTNSNYPKYRTWEGSLWSYEESASSISAYPSGVKLIPDPGSDEIFLMTSDSSANINIQKWTGSSWSDAWEVETSSSSDYECFDIAFFEQDYFSKSTPVQWSQWTSTATSTFENDSLSHLENAIETITADGLTAIDEGLFVANNELSSVDGNSTIVLMTDGLDNAGYHSLLEEAYRARDNNTTIYTVGFANNESEVDSVLEKIADITGAEYYFAPNSSVLKEIFRGIASQLTNFSAGGPVLDIHVPYNYITPLSVAKATYISGSSNATTGNTTVFESPIAPPTGNAEPAITTSSGMSILEWQLPNLGPGDKWGILYQMQIDGAGYVPLIMPTSSVTYTDLSGENITVYIPSGGNANLGGGDASVLSYALGSFHMKPDRTILPIANTANISLTLTDVMGNSSFAYVHLYSSMGYFEAYENPINVTVVGSDNVNFTSAAAGKAYITAYAYNVNDASDVLVAKDVLIIRPRGMITLS